MTSSIESTVEIDEKVISHRNLPAQFTVPYYDEEGGQRLADSFFGLRQSRLARRVLGNKLSKIVNHSANKLRLKSSQYRLVVISKDENRIEILQQIGNPDRCLISRNDNFGESIYPCSGAPIGDNGWVILISDDRKSCSRFGADYPKLEKDIESLAYISSIMEKIPKEMREYFKEVKVRNEATNLRDKLKSAVSELLPYLEYEKLMNYVEKIANRFDSFSKMTGGHSSKDVVSLEDIVIKIDANPQRAFLESRFAKLDLKEFNKYRPESIGNITEVNSLSLWAMEDVKKLQSGFIKSGISDPIEHYLYVMGLFHNHATKKVREEKLILPIGHSSIDGLKYIPGILLAYEKINLRAERELAYLEPLLEEATAYTIEGADCVIDGDFKKENTGNGYKFDFGSIRWGKAAEDLARYFITINLDKESITYYTGKYMKHRASHDFEFRDTPEKKKELYSSLQTLMLKENLRLAAALRRRPKEIILPKLQIYIGNAVGN